MKHVPFFKVLWALALSVALYSCNDDDDIDNETPPVVDEAIKNDAEAQAAANAAYPPLQTLSSSFSFLIESATEGTISFEGEEDEAGPEVSRFEPDENNWYAIKVFSRLYQSIGAANSAIERITEAGAVSGAVKTKTIAQAKFVRALAYSYLVQLYGEVPLVLETGEPTKVRSSIEAVYTQIVKDLTEAEAGLPDYDANPSNPSKGTANAILARVYLAWGSKPLTSEEVAAIANGTADPAFSTDKAKLEKAAEYADKVIKSGKYSLLADYTKLFGRANESKAPEHIFTIHHDGDDFDAQGNHQTHCAFTFTFELEKDNHMGPSDVNLRDRFEEADAVRRDFSYTIEVANPEENNKVYTFLPPVTLPRYGKGIDRSYENSVNSAITTNEVDRIEIRYAEVLLIKAEAAFELGNIAEALTAINEVRARAFGNTSHNLTAATLTREAVRKEWGLELAYEQKAWLNLVRWKTLISTVKTVKDFEHYDSSYKAAGATGKDGHVVTAFFAKVYKHLHAKYDNVKGKHYRFPIPVGEKSEDLGIRPQNPGY
ncbi:SusD family protein [Bacteroidales bacterium Barb6]|nr:SusD family protein [Bacteroidales bacterium Barb6]